MPGAFLLTAAPSGASWEQVLRAASPCLDGNGFVSGPWGECMHYAVMFELQSNWQSLPGYQDNGPAGQVCDFADEVGHSNIVPALEKNEEATNSNFRRGAQNFCFQGQPQGVAPTVMGQVFAPCQQNMGVSAYNGAAGYAGLEQILGNLNEVQVHQTDFSGCDCCICCKKEPCKHFPCCCCLSTSDFEISAHDDGEILLFAHEESGNWERLCCSPSHSLILKVGTQPKPEDDEDAPMPNPLVTMERKGCSNCFCTCCFSCCPNCNENMAVYEGDVRGSPGSLENAPKMHTMMSQPIGGGCFTPTLNIEPTSGRDNMTIKGPMIFGGWAEIVMDNDFRVMANDVQVATIKHRRPDDLCSMLTEFMTPLDRYTVRFDRPISPEAKANVVLSSLLVDYVFFELDDGPCYFNGNKLKCTFFFCNCCGCLCPCQCTVRRGGGGDDDE